MSVVAGKKMGNKVIIASDSMRTFDKGNHMRLDSTKVFRFLIDTDRAGESYSPLIIGSVGGFRNKHNFKRFMDTYRGDISNIKELHKLFVAYREWKKENHYTNNTKYKTSFLIGSIAGLHRYDTDDGDLYEVDYFGMGAGGDVANALLHEGYSPSEAVKVCCKTITFCGGDVQSEELDIQKWLV